MRCRVKRLGALIPPIALLATVCIPPEPSPAASLDTNSSASAPADLRTYELVDTWEDVPRQLRPGFVYEPLDVTSTPDGRLFVIDERPDGRFMHIFDDGVSPSSVVRLSEDARQSRIDAATDGTVYAVGRAVSLLGVPEDRHRYLVEQYGPSGNLLSQFHIDLLRDNAFTDIAVSADGWIYLPRVDTSLDDGIQPTAVLVLERDGHLIEVIESTDYYIEDHSAKRHVRMVFTRVDVAPNGTVMAVTRFPACT